MRWLRFVILAIIIPLAACTTTVGSLDTLGVLNGPYLLDTGDIVRIGVYGDADLSNLYRVEDNGNIAFPLIGPISVRGVTTQVAAARITAALANGFMRNPNVILEISQYRPFYIQGKVGASGQYPYVYGMTVLAAISTAGGFADTANSTSVILYRPQNGEMVKGRVGMDFPIQPGDTIVVPDGWQ